MDRLRVGIVGYGRIGRLRGELVARHPGFTLTAVADAAGPAAGAVPECPFFSDPAELLRRDLDAVFVCTPNAVTPDLVVAALDAGRHVFAEKPPGRTLDDVRRIRAAEARHPGLKLKFGFNHREHESVRLAASLVRSGELGRLMWMRGVYGKAGGPEFARDWRSDPAVAGGGILLDQGIHMLDLFRLFGGEFEEVKSFVGRTFWTVGLEDNAFALLRGADGRVAMLHSSSTHWSHTFRLEIYLSDGYLVLQGLLTGTRTYGRETLVLGRRDWNDPDGARGTPREERYHFDEDRSWERELDDFAACIVGDQAVSSGSSLDALRAMELVSRIYGDDAEEGAR
jgi:predicted dehydrogenase